MRRAALRGRRGRALRSLPRRAAGVRLGPRDHALPRRRGRLRQEVRARSRRCCAGTSTGSTSRWGARWRSTSTLHRRWRPAPTTSSCRCRSIARAFDGAASIRLRCWATRSRGDSIARLTSLRLTRVRATPPQTARDRAQRTRNVRNAFAVRRPARVAGRRVLLVDDVMTTGATADECARVLRAAGARRIDVLTLARVL